MKVLIAVLIFASFIQSSILPVNFVLLILVLRSYIVSSREDLYLAFFFGLLISHLNVTPLGVQSIIYLVMVELARIVGKLPISNNIFTVIILAIFVSFLNNIILSIVTNSSINIFPLIPLDGFISVPVYIALRFWEERFVAKKDIKLKI